MHYNIDSDPIFKPLTIRNVTFKNRIMSSSHALIHAQDGKPKENYQLYHEEKAKGGLALTSIGGSSNIAADSPDGFGQIYVGDDSIIPYFQEFSERIHKHDCKIMIQITHIGRRGTAYDGNWFSPIAPSRVREAGHGGIPREMDEHDIQRVIKEFGNAAARCKEGGLDGLEVLIGGHLVGQFMSPFTNYRTDRYGGSLENRAHFGLMVSEEIRKRVGDDFLTGIRFQIDDASSDGLSFEDCVQIAKFYEQEGHIDFINATYGRIDTSKALAELSMPDMVSPAAPFLERVGQFKKRIGLPVFHAAKISDIATARYAIKEGLLDMVAMTRGHIADPNIVNKVKMGMEDRIRPCVGATYCRSSARTCIHNVAIGREKMLYHNIDKKADDYKKVVVVGGGPAGLEAARVCALRGHSVTLLEGSDKLGGQINIASRTKWREDMRAISDWLIAEIEHLGVNVRYNCFAEGEDVLDEKPDVVFVATGGFPDIDAVEGGEFCTSVWDVLTGSAPVNGSVAVFDGIGMVTALSCAEHIAQKGVDVSVYTMDDSLGRHLTRSDAVAVRKKFYEADVDVHLNHDLVCVEPSGNRRMVTFINTYTNVKKSVEVDFVIVERGTIPNDEVYQELIPISNNLGIIDLNALLEQKPQPTDANSNGNFALYRVGDAVSSRDIHASMLDALRLSLTV